MTVTLNSAGGSSVPNWVHLASSPSTSTSITSFSGLSGYSKYRIVISAQQCTGSAVIAPILKLNGGGVTCNFYGKIIPQTAGNTTVAIGAGLNDYSYTNTVYSTAANYGYIEIDNALLAYPKHIVSKVEANGSTGALYDMEGDYYLLGAITSISLTEQGGTSNVSGNIDLYGAN